MAEQETTTADLERYLREQAAKRDARIQAARENLEHLERRGYGIIRVQTPREGVKIEQLLTEKPDKKNNR